MVFITNQQNVRTARSGLPSTLPGIEREDMGQIG